LEIDAQIKLPIHNSADLQNLEKVVEEKEKRKHLSGVLSSCAMETAAATTRSILRKVFTTHIGREMNWAGQRGGGKFLLKNM